MKTQNENDQIKMTCTKFIGNVLLALAISHICTSVSARSAKEVKEKTAAAAESAVEYTKEQKDAFIADMERKLAELKREFKEISAQADKTKNEKLKILEKRQKELEQDLKKLKSSTGKAWSRLRDGISKAWDQVADSFNEAKKEFQN
jgi:cell shape-determining protein MreC